MKQPITSMIFGLLLLGLAACTPVTTATSQVVPTEPSASAQPYYPLTTRTGTDNINRALVAVASGDTQQLRTLVEFTTAKCTHREGLGGPPKCREGEAEGTSLEALAFLSSEGSFLRKDEIGNWTGIEVSGVYAVYEVSPSVVSEQYYPAGRVVILFVRGEHQPAVALRIGERGIVRVDDVFDSSLEALRAIVEREASTVILPPKS